MQFFKVGGVVRDEMLGIDHNDVDYVAVCTDIATLSKAEANAKLVQSFEEAGGKVYLHRPEYLTLLGQLHGQKVDVTVAHDANFMPASLATDLQNRDFTINAMVEDSYGEVQDWFNSESDLLNCKIRTVLDPNITLEQDPIRVLRAIRLAIKLDFAFDKTLAEYIRSNDWTTAFASFKGSRLCAEVNKGLELDKAFYLSLCAQFDLLSAIFDNVQVRVRPYANT